MKRTPRPQLAAVLLAAALLPLTGCITVRTVRKTVVAPNVMDATLDQLIGSLDKQFTAIQSLQASVDITASTGGERTGEIKDIPSFAGYIFLRKPTDLRVIMLLPVIRSNALDMVSDGTNFKLVIPKKGKAIQGKDVVIDAPPDNFKPASAGLQPHTSGLDTLRPNIIRDSILIPAPAPDEIYTRTEISRVLPMAGRKEQVAEPDYVVTVLRPGTDRANPRVYERVRAIYINRVDLLPYQQDVYDHYGRVVTSIQYTKYARTNGIDYPMNILVNRPLDEYTLQIEITKLQLNLKFDDEQFLLNFPPNLKVETM